MKMFVANLTKQNIVFAYSVPVSPGVRQGMRRREQPIAVGQQVQLTGELETYQIDEIIDQHSRYGMVEAKNIDMRREFVGVCYNLDRPVPVQAIRDGIEANTNVLVARGRQYRQEAAVSVANSIEKGLTESGVPDRLQELDVSAVEEEPRGGYTSDKPFGEGTRVTKEREPEPPRRRARERRAA